MTMMISKFHKLIQSKVVWYIILGVIVIAFVGFFTPTMGMRATKQKAPPAGMLFGQKVMSQEYRVAYQNTYNWYALSSGRMPKITTEMAPAFRQEVWTRLASLRKAASEKIMVADSEVVRQIQQMPAFQGESGAFDSNVYKAVLKYLGISSTQVESIFREQLAIYKLMVRPQQAALISPYELRRAYYLYTDRFVLKTAVFPRDRVEKEVTVTREDAQALFAKDPEQFRMPAKVMVSYVEWNVNDFLALAQVDEGAALKIYNQNIDQYRIETTGDVAQVEYKDFDDVKDEITAQLRHESARQLATEEATALVVAASPQADGEQPDFAGAASANGLTVKSMPKFGTADEINGVDPTAPFKQAAFRLQDDAYSSFSDAVVGQDSVYVLSLDKLFPSRIPEFDWVDDKVMSAAREQAVDAALSDRATELQKKVSEQLESGIEFDVALKSYQLSSDTTDEFDITTKLDNQYANILIPLCLNTQQGELCRPVPVDDGILLAYVAQRKSTDIDVGLPAVRQEIIAGLSQTSTRQLTESWQDALLREADFKDLAGK